MRIVWAPSAIDDLRHLRAYIAEHDPAAAARVARAIVEGVEGLRRFPHCGRPGRVPDTRELVVTGTPFVIPYTVEGDRIAILAVLHAARTWPDGFGR